MYKEKGIWFLCIWTILMGSIILLISPLGEAKVAGAMCITPGIVLLFAMFKEFREDCKKTKKSRI